MIAREELAPVVIEQRSIGLERVLNLLAVCVLPLQLDDTLEERNSKECRLTALPRKFDRRQRMRLDVLAYVVLQHLIAHAEIASASRIHILFLEVIAVGA